jgi:diacylglycerol kinase (ATP)
MPEIPRKLLFIVNPNAGKGRSAQIVEQIRNEMPSGISYRIEIWKTIEYYPEIEKMLRSGEFTDAIAVGGDGTVNRVGRSLLNTGIALGIVGTGSGNGLARSLGLSLNVREAIHQIAAGKRIDIDSGVVNGLPFFCTAGTGFDARIGHLFATSTERGLKSYIKITLSELFRYRAKSYTLKFNDTTIYRKAFLITVANAGQYGNNFYIAPLASMQDGQFHVVVLKQFNIFSVWPLLFKILLRKAHVSRYVETITTSKLIIERDVEGEAHYDGEPVMQGRELVFENKPRSLKVIVGEKFTAV